MRFFIPGDIFSLPRISSVSSFGFIKNIRPQPPDHDHESRTEFDEPGRSLHQLPGIKAQALEQQDQPLGAQRPDEHHQDPGEPARYAPHDRRRDQQAQQEADHPHRRKKVRGDKVAIDQPIQPIPHASILQ